MKLNRNNTIVKMVIFFVINVFLVYIDSSIDNMLFTSLYRPVICFLTIRLLVKDKMDLRGNINRISGEKNIIVVIGIILLIIPFRIVASEDVIPIFLKSNIIEDILYYLSAFAIAMYEEINFRYIFTNIVYEVIEDRRISGVFSTIIFAMMHMTNYYGIVSNLINLIGAFVIGGGMYIIYKKYGLLQSSIVHFSYNVFLVLFMDYNFIINGIILIIYNIIFVVLVMLLYKVILSFKW